MSNKKNYVQNTKKMNPAMKELMLKEEIQAKINRERFVIVDYSELCVKLISFMVLKKEFDFKADSLIKFREGVDSVDDILHTEFPNFDEMLQSYTDKLGINITKEELCAIDPRFASFIADNEK